MTTVEKLLYSLGACGGFAVILVILSLIAAMIPEGKEK